MEALRSFERVLDVWNAPYMNPMKKGLRLAGETPA
jgi:hypothetical protein